MEETRETATFADAEQALLRAIVDSAEDGTGEDAQALAQALAILRQAQAVGGPAGGAASPAELHEALADRLMAARSSADALLTPSDGTPGSLL